MNFSTALRLNDVDDYIAPAQSCIKPVKVPTSMKPASITIGDDGSYVATDTSLLTERQVCVALSPQSVVSLCTTLLADSVDYPRMKSSFTNWVGRVGPNIHDKVTPKLVRAFCCDVLKRHGVTSFLDTTWSRDISLLKSSEEFVAVWKTESQQQQQPPPIYPDKYPRLPIISGICPGWVCYAEKANFKVPQQAPGESFLLKHLSHVRSPQQMLGGIIKRNSLVTGSSIFTVFVMPCYDKKLEASRHEFELPTVDGGESGTQKEVDLVLGTNEFAQALEALLAGEDEEILSLPPSSTTEGDQFSLPDLLLDDSAMYRHPGSGSGGYAFVIFSYAAKSLFGFSLPPDVVTDDRVILRSLGSADMQEILLFENAMACEAARQLTLSVRTPYRMLSNPPSKPLLSFLVANGFRNIQTVVQQLKRAYTNAPSSTSQFLNPRPFDYIEIMACPGGCLSGGAQIKNKFSKVYSPYFALEERHVLASGPSQKLLAVMKENCTPEAYFTTFRTTPRVEIINPSALKW
ncbi:unnamed protein product [Schistocephalus solidus]|uniref:Fe_hyd_lg_C domain-containing protein n=1 Tax=Schistocephalus solidus TaxID=70667 RepID=A0A183T599_SCHSO|nr:unnamed protein product [Schistocephalus solidus]